MECQAFGATVVKLDGLISDCGKYVAERKDREGWYDVSTLKEPYRRLTLETGSDPRVSLRRILNQGLRELGNDL